MSGEAIRVLLIEDNPADRRLVTELFREADCDGLSVLHAERLGEGLRMLGERGADVVLLDMSLPDSRGVATFSRAHAEFPNIPIILLTHLDDEETAVETVHRGAQDYLFKGDVTSHLLLRAVRYAIERRKLVEELEHTAAELRERNTQLTDDLHMAREIQQALLPSRLPQFPPGARDDQALIRLCHVYRPSAAVGGDYFNVFPVSDSAAGVFICDVMGHGMRAALVAAIVRGLLAGAGPLRGDPGRFLRDINRSFVQICRPTDQPVFASAFYAVVDSARAEVVYANAGHPDPVILRRGTPTGVEFLRAAREMGPVLGLFEDANYVTYRQSVDAGARLVLYTDGLVEALDETGQEYGRERLRRALAAGDALPLDRLLDGVLRDLGKFAADRVPDDDICLVGVELCATATEAGALPAR